MKMTAGPGSSQRRQRAGRATAAVVGLESLDRRATDRIMMEPRSRKRLAKMRRATTIMGCGCVLASSASIAAAMEGPSRHRVAPNNVPEGRRGVQRNYYRRLASQHAQENGAVEADDTAGGGQRQLYSSASHKKGNDVGGGDFTLLGSAATRSEESSSQPASEASPTQTLDAVSQATPATDLQKFTRIGGNGYQLPPLNRHPYMASLQLEGHAPATGEAYDVHMCTGFLVAADMVATAAHCAKFVPPGENEAVPAFNGIEVGKVDLSDAGVDFDPLSLETYNLYYENLVPKENFVASGFDGDTYEHDIMLVKVHGVSRFPPVKIANEWPDANHVTALGWGAESDTSSKKYSDRLRSAELDLLTTQECKWINVDVTDPYTGARSVLSLYDHIFDDMTCARSEDRYICHGDPGGPAIVPGDDSDGDMAVGVLSWGYGCVNPDYPAVLANLPDHYNWIRNTVCQQSSDPPSWFGCPSSMSAMSSGQTQRVTLKLKMDAMSVETGFVIEVLDTGEVVAQRQTGHYRSEMYGNEIVLEEMDLPANTCYRLTMLDSFGDGSCCDMGGGPAVLYKGTDTSYYTGDALVEINTNFAFDASDTFCIGTVTGQSNLPQSLTNHQKNPPPSPQVAKPPKNPSPPNPSPPKTPKPSRKPTNPEPVVIPSNQGGTGATWSGPVMNPEFQYCSQFCASSAHGTLCGNYECVLADQITSDAQEVVPLIDTQFYEAGSEYYLTVRFQFDDKPEDVSWVLYDLTNNEVKVFVDFDVYTADVYKNQLLDVQVTMDGPDEGERQYAFTVYDQSSDGLCCDHGQGYYKVYLGDAADDSELLGDDDYEFSSSYYFTLFEGEVGDDTYAPTAMPSNGPTPPPTPAPSNKPTSRPTPHPTRTPTPPPTTARPTEVWEMRRGEDADAIGARWNIRSNTQPGVFNDVGGDQMRFRFDADRATNAAPEVKRNGAGLVVGMVAGLACSLALAWMH